MRLLGSYFRRAYLSSTARRWALGQSLSTIIICAGVIAGVFLPPVDSGMLFGEHVATAPVDALYGGMAGAVIGRLLRIFISRSNWGKSTAEAARA